MSSLAFLVTELQSLSSETRRKHPEIREAVEKSLTVLRASPDQGPVTLSSDSPQAVTLLHPVLLGCATKSPKVVSISLNALQRLIALKAVSQGAIPTLLSAMGDAVNMGVDIQLRVLQTLVALVPNFPSMEGQLLANALLLCFKLQESRIAVVSSTAAATLRQLVMFVVDKMVLEDARVSEQKPVQDDQNVQTGGIPVFEVPLPDGSSTRLGPAARDAFSVFEDLCLLANGEEPRFLNLEFLHKTFALELIESVLTNYHELFRKHQELLLLLSHHLCPLLLKALSDRPVFPLMLRCTRVVFLLLKQFSFELKTETEVFMMLLIRIVVGDESSTSGNASSEPQRPVWMRVLAMEILRGLCSDAELMRNVYDRYDGQNAGSNVLGSLVSALKRLLTEKPALLGVCTQISGVNVHTENHAPGSNYGLDVVGGMAGRVATGVAGMISSSPGLSVQGSSMKLQCIDQLDKADSPPIPDGYIYLLALQCIISLSEGLTSFTGPLYNTLVIQRPRAEQHSTPRAPPALDLSTLPQSDVTTKHLFIVRNIIESGWPALLAALSFVLSTNLSDELFVDVLGSYQALTNVSGMLGLITPRDAFINSLAKFAVPTLVVSSLDTYSEVPQTPRSATTALSEGLGLGVPSGPPGLSERNLACLKVLLGSALFLAGILGESWYGVLEVLQNADYVLTARGGPGSVPGKRIFNPGVAQGSGGVPPSRSVSMASGSASAAGGSSGGVATVKHPLLSDLDPETMQAAIQRLFDATKNLEDVAFKDFVAALCRLSSEMVGMQTGDADGIVHSLGEVWESLDEAGSPTGLAPRLDPAHRRRVSGIHIPKTTRSGDFGIAKLGGIMTLNIHRLIYRSPEVAWNTTTTHLLSIVRSPFAPQAIRVQAARVLDELVVVIPRNLTTTGELQAQVQKRVLDVLAQQIVPDPTISVSSTSIELRRMGLETLHQILQSSGHTLVIGWEAIFQMLESVCRVPSLGHSNSSDSVSILANPPTPVTRLKPNLPGLGVPSDKGHTALVKIAFQSLTLVCDSVSSLSPEHLRLCISTLGHFGKQSDTNIALTAAASLLWSVSDAIQSKRKDAEQEPEYSELWMFLLFEVLGLCTDPRSEVRDGAIQTLFRTIRLYGSTLNAETWDQCIWKVTFPALDALNAEIRDNYSSANRDENMEQSWDQSKILALKSIGSIFSDFLISNIIALDSFPRAWDEFVDQVQDSVLIDNRKISSTALQCIEQAVKASAGVEGDLRTQVKDILQRVWETIDALGGAVLKGSHTQSPISPGVEEGIREPFTQESLVSFLNLIQSTRKTSRSVDGMEWDLQRLTRLMAILKGVLTYSSSPDYSPDIDTLPPTQNLIIDTITGIDLSIPSSPSLVIRDLSEYATLAFLAAFDVVQTSKNFLPQSRVTYIALSKKTMPMLVDLFMQYKESLEIYTDGTLEAVVSAYSIPIKLKYECPAPSKFRHDPPLWKTATTCFLGIVKQFTSQLKDLGKDISDDRVEGIWRQILDVFRGGILADCSTAESLPLDEQAAEESFDLALVASLESDVVLHLGDSRLPDSLVSQLAKMLHQASEIYNAGDDMSSSPLKSPQIREMPLNKPEYIGSTQSAELLPRERFAYWCFDLLFLICSATTQEDEQGRKRLAALSLSSLLNRCHATLVGYVADESLRGNMPFPRAREEELLYVLRKILKTKLWSGSLWAAFSEDPTRYCLEQPSFQSVDGHTTPSAVIADAVKRSTIAHLFHLYPVLCEIASTSRRTPTAWVALPPSSAKKSDSADANISHDSSAVELDARVLARDCLKEIGKEMGVYR